MRLNGREDEAQDVGGVSPRRDYIFLARICESYQLILLKISGQSPRLTHKVSEDNLVTTINGRGPNGFDIFRLQILAFLAFLCR